MATPDHEADSLRCIVHGCFCCYSACDCSNPLLCYKGSSDVLCYRHSCCFALNTVTKGCGCTTDRTRGECCKIGLVCCDMALIWPTKICGSAHQCLCHYTVSNFPCSNEFTPAPGVCTVLPCCQLLPTCGCCLPPPPCPALDKVRAQGSRYSYGAVPLGPQTMGDRGDGGGNATPAAPPSSLPGAVVTMETLNPDGSRATAVSRVNADGSTLTPLSQRYYSGGTEDGPTTPLLSAAASLSVTPTAPPEEQQDQDDDIPIVAATLVVEDNDESRRPPPDTKT